LQKGEEGFELLAELPPLAIPSTLQDSLMARLDQLERVKDVAQILGHAGLRMVRASGTQEVTVSGDVDTYASFPVARTPWNKGKAIGAKPPLRPKHVWSIRTKLQVDGRLRDIDSKLRGCDVVALKLEDVAPSGYAIDRANVLQRKTGRP
jgi:hypothetical protein